MSFDQQIARCCANPLNRARAERRAVAGTAGAECCREAALVVAAEPRLACRSSEVITIRGAADGP